MTYGFIKKINRTACGGTFKKRGCSKIDCGTVSALSNNSRRDYCFRYRSGCYFKSLGLIFVA